MRTGLQCLFPALREICREYSQAVFAEDELVTWTGSSLSERFLQCIATLNN